MKVVAAYPQNKEQEKAIKTVLKALNVPFDEEPVVDETTYLFSKKSNKKRLLDAIEAKREGKGIAVKTEDLWK